MRIALQSEKATLEFRQFPGTDFQQPMLIWGWVVFLARLAWAACAAGAGVPGFSFPAEGSEQELRRFLGFSKDPMLAAWFRDVTNRVASGAEAVSQASMQWSWEELWEGWLARAARSFGQQGDAGQLLVACGAWRETWRAKDEMRAVFEPENAVFGRLEEQRQAAKDFVQRLFRALEPRLQAYACQLRAAEEISRLTSLPTVVQSCTLGAAQLETSSKELRIL
ncbi:unnamed protein product [Polarella glacialis]|uniref:Uncharacterized protein n=1 Tax=Polarella glacialis TaxID=89957 RepID=A0A813LV70_POLGL|nr:unnamed protein product [Polarella glacialis]CAE8633934.1 unnamed protein product [Polarella glacialis]CAE8742401.1 unnamed protein product [Polarella glacialis]